MPKNLRILAPAVLLAATFAALLLGLLIGGAADERSLLDPGAIVRYGLPISRTIVNVAIAGLIGSLSMVVWAYSSGTPEERSGMDLAAGSAAVLTVASAATIVLTVLDVWGPEISSGEKLGSAVGQFLAEVEMGQLWLITMLIAAVTTVMAFAITERRLTIVVLIGAVATTLPLAQMGHAAGAASHAQAVNSLFVHLVGAAVWLGGLLALMFVASKVDKQRLSVLVARYSPLALLAFIGVSASGVVSAWLRIGNFEELIGTGYGQLVLLKAGSLIVLGAFGAVHRQFLIPRIASEKIGGRVFAWFVIAELAVMGIASGLAGALGRTATPVAINPARDQGGSIPPAEWLTGDPLPPELTPMSFITEWKFDLGWTLICFYAIAFYIAGVVRLRRRGDTWPIGRTIAWIVGQLLLFYTTNGALNAYERYLFSQHMLGHMMLAMLIPLVLVLAAPFTLALRAIPARKDGSWGGREWIMWALATPFSKLVTHPIFAAIMFSGSLWVFYYTPLARWAAEEHLGHQWMIIHFLISGYLFSLSMIGVDPVPYRFPYPLRIVTLFATMAAHAFFGVSIMTGDGLLLSDWYGAMGREWGDPPLYDQKVGGSIAWGVGELPTLALALIVMLQWSRNDIKVQRRKDRVAERSGEAELNAYNEMLAKQAERDRRLG